MDEKEREYILDKLRFFLQHTPSESFDVGASFDALTRIVEEEGPLKMAALHQMISMHELIGDNRKRAIEDVIDLARDGVRCCEHPCCPINLLIDVATAALAEGRRES